MTSVVNHPDLQNALNEIRARADATEATGEWPAEDLQQLAKVGALRWAIPKEFGGAELSSLELHLAYEAIASASLTTALILSQRDSGVQMLAGNHSPLAADLLPKLARGEVFTTIGIAQLTTSRQRGAPSLRATADADGFMLDGEIPWATGAAHSDFICAGAVMEDRRQILFALPVNQSGVHVQPPLPLVALRSSHTTSVVCTDVHLPRAMLIVPPSEQALASRKKAISIGQVFLAMGLCRSAIDLIGQLPSDAARNAEKLFNEQMQVYRADILQYCAQPEPADPGRGAVLRGEVISLAVRATHAAVSLYKGTALLAGHPAQRLAREAMFLLVWSCPSPVMDCTLELLSAPTPRGMKIE